MQRVTFIVIALMLMAGCESQPPPEPLVVYAPAADEALLATWFAEFTADTDIPVTAIFAASEASTHHIIGNRGTPPADVLISGNTADIWRAADEGALRPLQAEGLGAVPAGLKDADALWVAGNVRTVVVALNRERGSVADASFQRLAEVARQGQLCLLSPNHRLSRALLAMLIEELGNRPAERLVRGWVRALAQPPFDTEAALLAALQAGDCVYGIVSDASLGGDTKLRTVTTGYFDIDGVGVARHARNAVAAQQFVVWLLAARLPQLQVDTSHSASLAGWRDAEARQLAERAGYR